MSDITMPKLSDSMEQGTIIKWLKADGAPISAGEDLVEIETDKATMTYAAEADGVLRVVAPEGTTLSVGDVMARTDGATAEPGPADVDPTAEAAAPVVFDADAAGNGNGNGNGAPAPAGGRAAATPLARRIAHRHGVDLGALQGSGPRGRITRDDVLQAAGVTPPPAPAAPAPPAGPPAPAGSPPLVPAAAPRDGTGEIIELTRLQSLIASRMTEARATIPEFEVQTDVVVDELIALRARLKAAAGTRPVPSVNDLIVRAVALALREHRRVNASYADGRLRVHDRVNIGIAVAAETALIVPVVRDADIKSLGQIAGEARALAERVRAGTIAPADLEGGTFTVSNLGMFGMTAIRPVINPPQVAILGAGAARPQLARVDGEVIEQTVMTLTVSADHRVLYGADAARFLATVKELLQSPLSLAL